MDPLEVLLVRLADELAVEAAGSGGRVAVVAAEVAVPIETGPGGHGMLLASLPRGRLATGFQPQTGRLRAAIAPLDAGGGA